MVEDVLIGVMVFIALVVLSFIGRAVNFSHSDIWS